MKEKIVTTILFSVIAIIALVLLIATAVKLLNVYQNNLVIFTSKSTMWAKTNALGIAFSSCATIITNIWLHKKFQTQSKFSKTLLKLEIPLCVAVIFLNAIIFIILKNTNISKPLSIAYIIISIIIGSYPSGRFAPHIINAIKSKKTKSSKLSNQY